MSSVTVAGVGDEGLDRLDVMRAWRRAVSAPLDAATLQRRLEQTLECLDALIGGSWGATRCDLQMLADEVTRGASTAADTRGIDLTIEARGSSVLIARDLRRWTYLLQGALDSFLSELPDGSAVRLDLACVAATCGHRWLQADIVATLPVDARQAVEHRPSPSVPNWDKAGESGIRSLLIATALRLLDGACERTQTDAGPALRLVVPVEG
jgi:hypothetical protein